MAPPCEQMADAEQLDGLGEGNAALMRGDAAAPEIEIGGDIEMREKSRLLEDVAERAAMHG